MVISNSDQEKGLTKQGCVFPMVIWPAFRMGQFSVNDHPYHAPQLLLTVHPSYVTYCASNDDYQFLYRNDYSVTSFA